MPHRRRRALPPPSPGRTCAVCGLPFPVCRDRWSTDHTFVSLTAARRQRAIANEQAAAVAAARIAEIRALLSEGDQ